MTWSPHAWRGSHQDTKHPNACSYLLVPGIGPNSGLNTKGVLRLPAVKNTIEKWSGAEGDRTPDLSIANAALSQLSYCPKEGPLGRAEAGFYHGHREGERRFPFWCGPR